jgi:hypothetical protein
MNIRWRFDWRGAVGFALIAALLGCIGAWWLNLPWWVAACIGAGALLINGIIIAFEGEADSPKR